MTTIMDLYNWAIENDALDLPIGLQYQDEGGYYEGNTYLHSVDQIDRGNDMDNSDLSVSIESRGEEKYILLG